MHCHLIAFVGFAAACLATPPKLSPAAGVWEGPLDLGLMKVRIVFKVESKPDDTLGGTFDSPDQGAADLKLSAVSFTDGAVRFEYEKGKITYEGKLADDGKSIAGKWKQGGGAWPLELKRVDKPTVLPRPQHPRKPYPYYEEEVEIPNAAAKVTLTGTFTRPKALGSYPAVVLVSGSGPQDRDESLFGHKPFLVIADYLTRRGIAVLRYDDRGVGKSTGDHAQCTTADFVTDAYAAVRYLQGRPDVETGRVGIAGHSEGGIIGPAVAAEHPDEVGFIILLAGTGLPGDQISATQVGAILKASGKSEIEATVGRWTQSLLLAKMKKDAEANAAKKAAGEDVKPKLPPWQAYFLSYDPRPALRKVRCPVLALNGERDVQVTPKENLAAITAALAEGGNTRVTSAQLAGLNHMFQTCKTGSLSEYAAIEETVAPVVLETMADWILRLK